MWKFRRRWIIFSVLPRAIRRLMVVGKMWNTISLDLKGPKRRMRQAENEEKDKKREVRKDEDQRLNEKEEEQKSKQGTL